MSYLTFVQYKRTASYVKVSATVGAINTTDNSIPVTLASTGGSALWVTLISTAQGRFSPNVFCMYGEAVRSFIDVE
jgi:hypothetical protein